MEHIVCGNCGSQLDASERFCPKCGYAVNAVNAASGEHELEEHLTGERLGDRKRLEAMAEVQRIDRELLDLKNRPAAASAAERAKALQQPGNLALAMLALLSFWATGLVRVFLRDLGGAALIVAVVAIIVCITSLGLFTLRTRGVFLRTDNLTLAVLAGLSIFMVVLIVKFAEGLGDFSTMLYALALFVFALTTGSFALRISRARNIQVQATVLQKRRQETVEGQNLDAADVTGAAVSQRPIEPEAGSAREEVPEDKPQAQAFSMSYASGKPGVSPVLKPGCKVGLYLWESRLSGFCYCVALAVTSRT